MKFSDDFLSELRSRVDIEEVIGKYTEIRHRGSRTPVALCPFHTEKTPSFVIYRDTQSYYCFGCGAGGDVVTFIKNIERLDYTEAVRYLCDRAGMSMPIDREDDEGARLRRRCYEANRESAKFFYSQLSTPGGKVAVEYIEKRRFSAETVKKFGMGYAPDRWDALLKHLRSLGFSENELIAFDLAKRTQKGNVIDNFRNRLMIPIIDLRGNVIAFGGRVLDDSKPKYINTSDTIVYKKGNGIYGLNIAKNNNTRTLILCEGYMDVIAMHQAGYSNAVAALGTAFTTEQVSLLSRYCDELILSFDSDNAGQKATERALRMTENSTMKVRIMTMTDGKDPDEVIKNHGKERMNKIIDTALNRTEFALSGARAKYDISTDDGKLSYARDAVKILAEIRNGIDRDLYISRVADELQLDREAVKFQVQKQIKNRERQKQNDEFNAITQSVGSGKYKISYPEKSKFPRAAKAEEIILATLLRHPDYLKRLKNQLSESTFVTEWNRRFFNDIARRINDGRSLQLTAFSGDSDNADMSYLTFLVSYGEEVNNDIASVASCVKLLEEEKQRPSSEAFKSMSDSDFKAEFEKIRKKKAVLSADGSK